MDTQYFQLVGHYNYFWTSTEQDASQAFSRRMYFNHGGIARTPHDKELGYSVRCLRDS